MVTTSRPPALSNGVSDVFRRAQEMVADGKNSTKDVAKLIGDIGRLPDAERKELFDAFELVKQQAGAPKSREAVEVFLGALRDKPAQLLSRLEKDDGIIDMKDAMTALSELGNGAALTGKQRVSVFTMMLVAKTTPEARDALLSVAQGRSIDVDKVMRQLLQRGNVTADEINAIKTGVGNDPYGSYQLSYWHQTTQAKDFAPGGREALQGAAEETYGQVGRHYKEDLELNRGRPPSPRGAVVLDIFSRETLQLNHRVTFADGCYECNVNGSKQTYDKPDNLAAFLIETALKTGGHDIDQVRWDAADGGRYVVKKRGAEAKNVYHTEVLRQFGYKV